MTATLLTDEFQARLTAEVDAIYAARCAAGHCAKISSREGRDAQAVKGALTCLRDSRGRKYASHRQALNARFGTTDLLYLARRRSAHAVVQRAVRAVLKANGLGDKEAAAFARVQAAEDAVATAADGPLAAHGEALAALFGTRDIVEAERDTMRFYREGAE